MAEIVDVVAIGHSSAVDTVVVNTVAEVVVAEVVVAED